MKGHKENSPVLHIVLQAQTSHNMLDPRLVVLTSWPEKNGTASQRYHGAHIRGRGRVQIFRRVQDGGRGRAGLDRRRNGRIPRQTQRAHEGHKDEFFGSQERF